MIDAHARQPNDISNYVWVVVVATIVLIVVLSIIGLRTLKVKREQRKKRQAEAREANDKIFNPIIREPLTAPAPSPPGQPVRKRSLAI